MPLGTQIVDLRSQVVGAACATIEKLFAVHGAALSPLLLGILPPLLKNCHNGVKVIASTSSKTLHLAVGASPTREVFSSLVQWSTDSHHQTRRACVESIAICLAVDAASVTPQQLSTGATARSAGSGRR